MELWDIYSKEGVPTGKTVLRGSAQLRPGEYHLVVHIWVIGSDGRLLIQKRSDSRPLMPGEWAATGGAAVAGEDSVTAAQRELFEELGICVDKREFVLAKRIFRRNSFVDMYIIRRTVPVSRLKLQEDEVSEVRKVYKKQLVQMVRQGKFHNYGKEYFDALLEAISKKAEDTLTGYR